MRTLAVFVMIVAAGHATAVEFYSINASLTNGLVTGTIVTDGSSGALSESNILGWNLTINFGDGIPMATLANGTGTVGFDRNGYDVNGYNANGYSRNGFDRNGFDLNHCARYVLAAERRCVQRSHRDHHVTSPAQPIGELDDRDVTPVDGVVSPFFSGTCTGRVSLLTTQAKSGARMKKIEKNGFVLASSGSATQVVLYSHGGWIESDGVTTIPMGLTLCFYAGHGHYTVGNSVYGAVVKKGATARGGFMKQIAMSEEDLAAYAQMKGKSVDWARDEFMKNAVGTYDSFQGGNPMFNYALSREPKGQRLKNEQDVFKKHMKGGGHADVDLIMMTTSGGRHLSDVFTLIEGRGYATLHFGACRVSYGSSPSEVSK